MKLVAAFAGTVLRVEVEPGDTVGAGATLLVLESMKMEHVVVAATPGRIDSVAVEPGAAVPPLGLWLITVPDGCVEVGSGLTETWKPLAWSSFWATVSCWPTTEGTATGAAPVETYSVTRVFAATLLPCAGLESITQPFWTLLLGSSTTTERRFWAAISCLATATGSARTYCWTAATGP